MVYHKQKKVYNPIFKDYVDVDSNMVRILSKIWELGFVTYNSCEDNNGLIWLEFDIYDGMNFFEILNRYFLNFETFGTQVGTLDEEDFPYIENVSLDINYDNAEIDPDDENCVISTANVYWALSVRFPQHYYAHVMVALKLYGKYYI